MQNHYEMAITNKKGVVSLETNEKDDIILYAFVVKSANSTHVIMYKKSL